ncbi:MAG: MMPL family transporter [Acidimicrobiales bacterium]
MVRLAQLVTTWPKRVLAIVGVLVVAAGVYGRDAPSRLSPAGYEVIGSDSTVAAEVLANAFETGPANLVLLVTVAAVPEDEATAVAVDGAAVVVDGLALGEQLAAVDDVADVNSYWVTGIPQLRSASGDQAIITARIVATEDEVYERAEAIREEFAGPYGLLDVGVGGSATMNLEVVEESERDLLRAELIAIPLTTIIMLFVFRSVIAALLPLIVSAVAVGGTAAALKGLSEVSLVSIFALNLTTALGLGMGVDYSLFLLARWREERAAGREPTDAVSTAVVAAGRPILFSGLTTAATLAALLLFDYPLLRSLAIAGFVVVVLAAVGALLALPAAMTVLGERIDRWTVRRPRPKPVEEGRWYALAQAVMRRPKLTAFVTIAILLTLGAPFLRAQFGIPDDRALPLTSPSRLVADDLRRGFDAREFGALAVVSDDWSAAFSSDADADVAADTYAVSVSSVNGVERVETATGLYVDGDRVGGSLTPGRFVSTAATPGEPTGRWFSVVPNVEPISAAGEEVVAAVRSIPVEADVLVGGESARLVDNKAEIVATLPLVLAWVVVAISALLYRSFGSVLIPLKAIFLNLLSLTAAFGAIVWIFQDGRLSGVLGFTPTGLTDAQTPVLIFCIAFGLSMDYEVFLLSRIKEEWDLTGDTRRSVAVGLQRTGGVITAAAILMAVVFLAFASGKVTFIQMVGVGLALSIIMDATLVRSFLLPAFMVLAGRWNWWSPWRRQVPGVGASVVTISRTTPVGVDPEPVTEGSRT